MHVVSAPSPTHTNVFLPSRSIQICGQVRGAMSVSAAMLVSGGGVGVCLFYLLYSVVVYCVELVFCWVYFQTVFLPVGFSSAWLFFPGG